MKLTHISSKLRQSLSLLPATGLLMLSIAACSGGSSTGGEGNSGEARAASNSPEATELEKPAETDPALTRKAPPVTSTPTITVAGAGPPQIEFEFIRHDFGKIDDTTLQRTQFKFRNTGGEKLIISEVKPSCGCTATELARTEFEPGEGDSIEVEFQPKGHGHQSKTIRVVSNATEDPVITLIISSEITPFIKVDPTYVRFEEVQIGQQHTSRVSLTSTDPLMEIIDIRPVSTYVSAKIADERADGNGKVIELEVSISDKTPWGQFNASVNVLIRARKSIDAEPIEHKVRVSISAAVFGDVRVVPAFFSMGAIGLKEDTIPETIRVRRVNGEEFKIISLQLAGKMLPQFKYSTDAGKENGEHFVDVTLSGNVGDFEGLVRGKLTIITDVDGEAPLDIDVMGNVRELNEKDYRIRANQARKDALGK